MNIDLIKSYFILICLFTFSGSQAQEKFEAISDDQPKSNTIYGTYGLFSLNGNYERLISVSNEKRFFTSYWAKVGFGLWSEPFGGRGTNLMLAVTALTGAKNNHLEVSLGGSGFYDREGYDIGLNNSTIDAGGAGVAPQKSAYQFFRPAGALGYRFQKQNGRFIFRTGMGFPDLVYLSFGFCF